MTPSTCVPVVLSDVTRTSWSTRAPCARAARTIAVGPDFEVREVRDGRLLLAVPHDGSVPSASFEQFARRTLERLKTTFSGSDTCRLLSCHVGRRPMPADGPIVGYVTEDRSVYVTVMHSAVTLAPTVGRLVADELVSGKPAAELQGCRPDRHLR